MIAQGQKGRARVEGADFQSPKLLTREGQRCMASSQQGLQPERGFLSEEDGLDNKICGSVILSSKKAENPRPE